MRTKPSSAAAIPTASGTQGGPSPTQPVTRQAMTRMISCGIVCHSETSIEATGNISRGIAILPMTPRLDSSEWVPAVTDSVK